MWVFVLFCRLAYKLKFVSGENENGNKGDEDEKIRISGSKIPFDERGFFIFHINRIPRGSRLFLIDNYLFINADKSPSNTFSSLSL